MVVNVVSMESRRESVVVVAEDVFWVLWRKLANRVAGAWPSVAFSGTGIPPHGAEQADKARYAYRVIHVVWLYWFDSREEQHHTDEDNPCHGDGVDRLAPASQCVWTGVEDDSVFVPSMRNDDGDIGKIQSRCGDVEDGCNGEGGANADQIQTAAEHNNQPDSVDGCVGVGVYFAPESGPSQFLRSMM